MLLRLGRTDRRLVALVYPRLAIGVGTLAALYSYERQPLFAQKKAKVESRASRSRVFRCLVIAAQSTHSPLHFFSRNLLRPTFLLIYSRFRSPKPGTDSITCGADN
jgi:hypothetical protein